MNPRVKKYVAITPCGAALGMIHHYSENEARAYFLRSIHKNLHPFLVREVVDSA